jgi:hypothetical protein
MPNGMSKRTLNKSTFNTKEGAIVWTVFVVFVTGSGAINVTPQGLLRADLESQQQLLHQGLVGSFMEGVNENKTLSEIFDRFVEPTSVS